MKRVNLKKAKFKFNNSAVIIFSIVFVILLNISAILLEGKVPQLKLDLTESAMTKISNETKNVLASIDEGDEEIELIYLKGKNDVQPKIKDVLEQYDAYSENITYKIENYINNPVLLADYSIDSSIDVDGSVIVATKDKSKVRMVLNENMEMTYNNNTVFLLENLLTNAIGVVASNDRMKVSFVTGHEENSSDMLINLLKSQNINVTKLDLSTDAIDNETDLVMIMTPAKDFTMSEINAIDDYMNNGGNVAVALGFGSSLTRLEAYLKEWGIQAENDIILEQDKSSNYQESGMYFYSQTTDNEVVSGIKSRILNSYARSLEYTPVGDIEADMLLTTTSESYSVPVKNGELDKANMTKGAYPLAYLLEKPLNGSFDRSSKLIVTSSASVWGVAENIVTDFDYHVYYSLAEESFGNAQFVMNVLSNVYGETIQSIYVPIKTRQVSILNISQDMATAFQRVFCLLIPVLVLLCGVAIWLKRRNK